MFIQPMLAAPMPKKPLNLFSGEWVAEEKFDGHRMLIYQTPRGLTAWSRLGNVRELPAHLKQGLAGLPLGIYDGELLVPGKRSYNVTDLDELRDLTFVAFDLLHMGDYAGGEPNLIKRRYYERANLLSEFTAIPPSEMCYTHSGHPALRAADINQVDSTETLTKLLSSVWQRDGEGLILKRLNAAYEPGKRPKLAWIKMKNLQSAVLEMIGYQAGKLGPHATQMLRDDDGNVTTVKWKNMDLLSQFNANPLSFIGRKVRIEFQERTPDGNYRHPRWDRFEDE